MNESDMRSGDMRSSGSRPGGAPAKKTYIGDAVGQFFEDFTEVFEGRRVAVEERGADGQTRVVADERPLQAFSYQVDGNRFDVRIVLGTDGGGSFAHVVPDVRRIDLDADDNGAAETLHIQSSSGLTDLRFR